MKLQYKVAVVTGSARGSGRALPKRWQREARVAITDRDGEAARETAREIGGHSVAIEADVSNLEQVGWLFEKTAAQCKRSSDPLLPNLI